MSKHTPGPWRVGAGQTSVIAGDLMIRQLMVVNVKTDKLKYVELEEMEANARLIAESPRMLELLRKIVAHFGDECHNHVPLLEAECLIDRIDGKPETDFSGVEF